MSTGLEAIYDRYGDAAVFTKKDASTTDCSVIVDHNLSSYGGTAEINAKSVIISVRISELAAVPKRQETFTITASSKVYTVAEVLQSDGFEHRCLAA